MGFVLDLVKKLVVGLGLCCALSLGRSFCCFCCYFALLGIFKLFFSEVQNLRREQVSTLKAAFHVVSSHQVIWVKMPTGHQRPSVTLEPSLGPLARWWAILLRHGMLVASLLASLTLLVALRESPSMSRMAWNSLCILNWPETHYETQDSFECVNTPASTSLVLGLQTWATTQALVFHFG